MANQSFDVVVIGGGPGGYIAAIRAAQLGLKSACIESRGTLGGTCLNVGCIPSKAMLESSEMFVKISHAKDYGITVKDASPDIKGILKRKDSIVGGLTKGVEGLLKKNKVNYLKGFGSFVNANQVKVTDASGNSEVVDAKNVIIATGSEPIELPFAKFDGQLVVSSTEALDFTEVPKHLVVIGGGVIGLELGSVWLRLGAKVSVVEAMPEILYTMDGGIRSAARRILEKQGFEFYSDTKVKDINKTKNHAVVVAQGPNGQLELKADKVLVAVGRRPFTKGLALENAGVATDDRGRVAIDAHYRTNVPNIYAIGDVVVGPMLAHKAEEEGVATAELIAGKPGHVNYEAIPNVVYTWPEIASVGMTEDQIKEKGIEYRAGQFPFLANARAKCLGSTDGFVKILADAKTDRLLGAHIIGPTASELIAEMAVAFEFGASAEDIARSVHAHPTLAEAIKEAALAVDKRTLNI
jgi:dihydrolipoamide dehydrogenase